MRRRDAHVPAAAEAARPRAARARHGRLEGRGRHRRVCGPASDLSCDRRSRVDARAGEEAIRRGLSKRLEQLADERERRERAAARGGRGLFGRIPVRRAQGLHDDRRGRLGHASRRTRSPRAAKANKHGDRLPRQIAATRTSQSLLVPARGSANKEVIDFPVSGEVDRQRRIGRALAQWSVKFAASGALLADAPHRFVPTQGGRHRERPQEQARGQEEARARRRRRRRSARSRSSRPTSWRPRSAASN